MPVSAKLIRLQKYVWQKKIKQHMNYKFYQENTLIGNYENILLQFQNMVHLVSIYLSGEKTLSVGYIAKYSGHSKA